MIRELLTTLGDQGSRPVRRLVLLLAVAGILQGIAFALLVPLLGTLLGAQPNRMWPWLAALVVCSLGYAAVQFAALGRGFTAGAGIARVLHHRLADCAVDLPLGWFTSDRAAELARLASQNVMQVMNVPAHLLGALTSSVLTPLTICVATFLFDWRAGLILLVCAPVLLAVHIGSTRVVRRLDLGRDSAIGESAERVLEFARNQPVLRAFGRTEHGYAALDQALARESAADRALIVRGVPGLVSFAFAARMLFALVLAADCGWVLAGSLTVPRLLALVVLTGRLVDSVSAAADLGAGLRMARNSLDRLNALLAEPPFPRPADPVEPTGTAARFDRVGFRYPGDPSAAPVLADVDFALPETGLTALVGPSGAGKTTIAHLLARFWDATEGAVRIGGVDVRRIAPDRLASLVSIVFQDVYLFDGSIADNVRVGAPDASDEQLQRAAAQAGLDRVVGELPDGWATRVGEGGIALSGGQRQRVSIARALVKDTPILVLDEASAALDPENEAVLAGTVAELATRKSLLVIAHRPRTVVSADQILVLEAGRITERGTHNELADAGGAYAEFWRQRTRAAGWRLAASR
jgi:ATP-binding cassette subfamily B protein